MVDPSEPGVGKATNPKGGRTRLYRLALIASLGLNLLLGTAFWLYVHFAETLSMIADVVGWFD